jgi:MerR family transcriptional regulator, copper efflux regulator
MSSIVYIHSNKPDRVALKIGDLAKESGKTVRALRLYEEMGLLSPGMRSAGGFRLYGADAIARVHWIAKLQELGFTLPHIQELVGATFGERVPRDAMARVRTLFHDKLKDVELQVARLAQLQKELASSLQYLESCNRCDHDGTQAPAAHTCHTCTDHTTQAPSLVNELTAPGRSA